MVSQLVQRLERDARFASDVSHELRSPLTTLATTATVLSATPRRPLVRRPGEPRPARSADLAVFQSLVEDLLEMRAATPAPCPLVMETVSAIELVRQSVRSAAQHDTGSTSRPSRSPTTCTIPWSTSTDDDSNASSQPDRQRAPLRRRRGRVRIDVEGRQLAVNVDDAGLGRAAWTSTNRSSSASSAVARPTTAASRAAPGWDSPSCATTCSLRRDDHVLESPEGGARFQIRVRFITQPVYIVDAAGHLSSLSRIVTAPASLTSVLDQVIVGPTKIEKFAGYASDLPSNLLVLQATVKGKVAYIDISESLAKLSRAKEILAIGQLVFTAYYAGATNGIEISVAGTAQKSLLPDHRFVSIVTAKDCEILLQP
jgi:hypothetical protein